MTKRSHSQQSSIAGRIKSDDYSVNTAHKARKLNNASNMESQRAYGKTKYAADDSGEPCHAWRTSFTSLARYNDMNCLFATQFFNTANELAKRSEEEVESVFAMDKGCLAAQGMGCNSVGNDVDGSSQSGLGILGAMDDVLMPPLFAESPDMSPAEIDRFLAVTCPPASSPFQSLGESFPCLSGTDTSDWSLGCTEFGDSRTLSKRKDGARDDDDDDGDGDDDDDDVLTDVDPSISQKTAMARGCQDGRLRDAQAVPSVCEVRRGLMELENCLHAHVKDQLLQLKA